MKKNRSTKELLQFILEQGNQNFNGDQYTPYGYLGLCSFFRTLYAYSTISTNEYALLLDFLNDHKPKSTKKLWNENLRGYYWPRGEWKPRKKWLKYHINKSENEKNN